MTRTDDVPTKPASTDVAVMTLVIAGLAGLVVPPSLRRPGLTDLERLLFSSILPLLLLAFVVALAGLFVSRVPFNRASRLLSLLSLACVNLAGLFSGRYGTEGVGLIGTLLVTLPVAGVIWQREATAKRPDGARSVET